ncbi:STAS-like domain-containing protein [Candidatus Woesearchaeota archaeon]|nr:STAS-like domain-containing protein [Candidatus Woesearchaeota archaeon]
MNSIKLFKLVGNFAENKDIARDIRIKKIIPAIEKGEEVTLDFEGVNSATQSFVHALISDIIRKFGVDILDKIYFKNCDETIKKIINIVVEYMQEMD